MSDAEPDDGPDALDAAFGWLIKHGALPAVCLVVLGLCMVYGRVFTGELVGDDLSFHFAESARLADCLRHGDFDFWNPSANGGFASAYYYQVLPQLASAIPTAIFGHHLFWFQLSVFLPLVLAPLAAYRGMRLMGCAPWEAAIAAFVLAFTIGDSRWGYGSDGTFSIGLYTQTWALSAFPLALGHIVRWARDGKGLAPAIAWGAFVGLCHPFGGVSLAAAVGIGAIAGAVTHRATWRSPMTAAIVLGILGILTFAVASKLAPRNPWFALPPALMLSASIRFAVRALRRGDPAWRASLRTVFAEPARLCIVGAGLAIATMPGWLTMFFVDTAGFGGFPHRVNDEVGPGFGLLWKWIYKGMLLDRGAGQLQDRSVHLLTYLIPLALVVACVRAFFTRVTATRWLWPPAVLFGLLLGVGPLLPKTGDDLIAPVRFLGAMQLSLALGIGASVYALGAAAWHAKPGTRRGTAVQWTLVSLIAIACITCIVYIALSGLDKTLRPLAAGITDNALAVHLVAIAPFAALLIGLIWIAPALRDPFWQRTLVLALGAIGVVLTLSAANPLASRVRVLAETAGPEHPTIKQPKNPPYRDEMMQIIDAVRTAEPKGRKQVGPGCENHWWNLLSYVYARVPSTLQMGGGGLQASPNYDFLWTVRDFAKNAWVFDAPYLVFEKSKGATMPVGDVVIETPRYVMRRLPTPGLVSPIQVTGVLLPGPVKKDSVPRKAALAWMSSSAPLENKHLAYAGSGPPGPPPQGKTLRAWRQDSPGDEADIVAEVEVTAPTTFVIRESWHPRWRAYIDGKPAPVRRVTPDFPAVDVTTPGKHLVQLRFERPWFIDAAWLAWPGTALLAWLLTVWLPRRRERVRLPQARIA